MSKQKHDIGHQKKKKNGLAYEALKDRRHHSRMSEEVDKSRKPKSS